MTVYQVPPNATVVESIVEAGADRILFALDTAPEAETLRGLDAMAKLIGRAGSGSWHGGL
ncbi:hypothetical protein AB0B50_20695 [Streptomyces sp. NPDC041068]|uniref:hypothetical protein n=1 Tax=Streptomyces sp. NPDC041068 TaxID=3155130 RepID=UPI0033F2984B